MKKMIAFTLLFAMMISICACSRVISPKVKNPASVPTVDDSQYAVPTGESGETVNPDATSPVSSDEQDTTSPDDDDHGTASGTESASKETEPKETTPPPTEPGHEHKYTDKVVAPTCEAKGYTEHKCSCGSSYKDTYTDPIGHKWDNGKTVAATCSEGGYKLYTCTRSGCNKTEKRDKTAALGHVLSKTASSDTPPSCSSAGKRTYKCTRSGCNYSKTENYGSALGHQYTSTTSTNTVKEYPHVYDIVTTTYTCSRCSNSYSETGAKTLHKYDVNAAMAWGNNYALSIGYPGINYNLNLNNASYFPYDIVEASFIYDYGFEYFTQEVINGTANQLDSLAEYWGRSDDHTQITIRCYIWYIESSDSYGIACLYG